MDLRSEIRSLLERSSNTHELAAAIDRLSRRAGAQVRLRASGAIVRIGVGREGWYQTEWLELSPEGWRCSPPSDARFSLAIELLMSVFAIDDTHV